GHLGGGLVRERDRQNLSRRNSRLDQAGDPPRDDTGLPRAGTGQHEQRPFEVIDRLPLSRVEIIRHDTPDHKSAPPNVPSSADGSLPAPPSSHRMTGLHADSADCNGCTRWDAEIDFTPGETIFSRPAGHAAGALSISSQSLPWSGVAGR